VWLLGTGEMRSVGSDRIVVRIQDRNPGQPFRRRTHTDTPTPYVHCNRAGGVNAAGFPALKIGRHLRFRKRELRPWLEDLHALKVKNNAKSKPFVRSIVSHLR